MALPLDAKARLQRSLHVRRPWYIRLRLWWHRVRGHDVGAMYYPAMRRFVVACDDCMIKLDFVDAPVSHG